MLNYNMFTLKRQYTMGITAVQPYIQSLQYIKILKLENGDTRGYNNQQ